MKFFNCSEKKKKRKMKTVKFNGHLHSECTQNVGSRVAYIFIKNKNNIRKVSGKSNGVGGKCARLVVLIIKNQKDFNENNSL